MADQEILTQIENFDLSEVCCDSEYLYFVHGTAIETGKNFGPIDSKRGSGDFGEGFYTFPLCGDDHETAIRTAKSRAVNKAKKRQSPNSERLPAHLGNIERQPLLIYLRILKSEFDALNRLDNIPSQQIYSAYYRYQTSDYDVMIGLMLYGNGKICFTEHPIQYKFENNGIAALEIIGQEIL